MPDVTEIRVDERGDEHHESWLLVGANHVASTGRRLFDSDIPHQRYVEVTVSRCVRGRRLYHDRLHSEKILMRFCMSQAQWGAFVSSFGQGDGVAATLNFLAGQGAVPQAPDESRLDESQQEVRDAGRKALQQIGDAYQGVVTAFEDGNRRALRGALSNLGYTIQNAPPNMEFAAESLTEHVENVVTKARADIEAMAIAAVEQHRLAEAALPELVERTGEDAS